MQRRTIRLAGTLALVGALVMALVAPAAILAADPSSAPAASDQASDQPTDGNIVVDPTFVTTPTATPVGAVLGATGRPEVTLPPTDAVAAEHPAVNATAEGILLVALALATISLVVAPKPEVRPR